MSSPHTLIGQQIVFYIRVCAARPPIAIGVNAKVQPPPRVIATRPPPKSDSSSECLRMNKN